MKIFGYSRQQNIVTSQVVQNYLVRMAPGQGTVKQHREYIKWLFFEKMKPFFSENRWISHQPTNANIILNTAPTDLAHIKRLENHIEDNAKSFVEGQMHSVRHMIATKVSVFHDFMTLP